MGRPAKTLEQRGREELATLIRTLVEAELEEQQCSAEEQRECEVASREARLDMREYLDQMFPGSTRVSGQDY